jgi:hypothetical protein
LVRPANDVKANGPIVADDDYSVPLKYFWSDVHNGVLVVLAIEPVQPVSGGARGYNPELTVI